jgi:nucleotide-binding universal stress UspA family protein
MLAGRSILCPVDFSEQSRAALRWAVAIARRRSLDLTVLFVVDPLLAQAAGVRLGVDLVKAEAEPALRDFIATTLPERAQPAWRVRTEVTTGRPADEILLAGRRHHAGLIVMGTHGLGGLRKLLLGSTTEQVLRRTEWPVLTVPAGAGGPPEVVHTGGRLTTILLATDFAEGARAATQWAADLADDIHASLVLAHVVEPVVVPPWWQLLVAEFEGDRAESGRRMLEQLAAGVRDTPTECVVALGRAADTIASMADERDAILVVLGLTNGEDAEVRRPGSIAYRVLRIAHVAVVVVPAVGRPLTTGEVVVTSEPVGTVP